MNETANNPSAHYSATEPATLQHTIAPPPPAALVSTPAMPE